MVYVIKVKYGETIRRFTSESKPRGEELSFSVLENRIRRLFDIPAEKQIRVTYNDRDSDVITMADDQDLVDALIMQSLNPLRLHVVPVESKSTLEGLPDLPATLEEIFSAQATPRAFPRQPEGAMEISETPFKQILKGLTSEHMKQACEPLIRGAAASPRQLSELVDVIVKMVTSQVSAAVKSPEIKSLPIAEVFSGSSSGAPRASSIAPVSGISRVIIPHSRPYEVSSSPVKNESTETSDVKSVTRVCHNGVECDVCGMSPIAGTRFKSIKKHDYDLCSNCFNDADDQAEYTRIDRPLYRPRHLHSPGSGRMRCPALDSNYHPGGRHLSMSGPYCSRPAGRWGPLPQMHGAVQGGKLDSRFVEDVTIIDGTEMAPGTRFTKIWRLRNSGKIPWAPLTKLVHVGGDELGSVFVVPLELPEQGLLPQQEIEAAVDLIAPEKPGRYVSHWRLASPGGPKFGHRVWVVIQVLTKDNSSLSPLGGETVESGKSQEGEVTENTPLLAPVPINESRESFVKASHEAVEQSEGKISYPEVDMTSSFVDITEPFSGVKMFETGKVVEVNREEKSPNAVPWEVKKGEDSPVVGAQEKVELPIENVVQEEVVAVESSELGGGFSMVEMPPGFRLTTVSTTPRDEVEYSRGNNQEQKVEVAENVEELNTPEELSVKLEAMGFSDRKLNVELLVRNKLDLRRTLDDLFAAAEWDPILEELEEMGFYDTAMNRRLMFKNNGSVKRVVKELVQMYKEPAEQGKGKGLVME